MLTLFFIVSLTIPLLSQPTPDTYTYQSLDCTDPACQISNNLTQSPIDIPLDSLTCVPFFSVDLIFNSLYPAPITIVSQGNPKTIETLLPRNFLTLVYKKQGIKSELLSPSKMIYRIPSEHTINGSVFPLELQIYFNSPFDRKLVLSILFNSTKTNSTSLIFTDFLNAFQNAPILNSTNNISGILSFSFEYSKLFSHNNGFYNYVGGMTSDCFTEPVEWIILKDNLQVNMIDLSTYQNLLNVTTSWPNNTRTIQDIGNRIIINGGSDCETFYSSIVWFSLMFASLGYFVIKLL